MKRAKKAIDIAPELLISLNRGEIAAKTFIEMTAVDFFKLMERIAPELTPKGIQGAFSMCGKSLSLTQRMAAAGRLLAKSRGMKGYLFLRQHTSDTVRGWAAYMLPALPNLELEKCLELIEPLAEDAHFGVREWAWLALRPMIAENIAHSLRLLTPWAHRASANLRRFAVESTRPRGFWSKHITSLKDNPAQGLPLLTPLRADPARYVQLAVANWLNDASKQRPDWVRQICSMWMEQKSPATAFIVRRALRSLPKG